MSLEALNKYDSNRANSKEMINIVWCQVEKFEVRNIYEILEKLSQNISKIESKKISHVTL